MLPQKQVALILKKRRIRKEMKRIACKQHFLLQVESTEIHLSALHVGEVSSQIFILQFVFLYALC